MKRLKLIPAFAFFISLVVYEVPATAVTLPTPGGTIDGIAYSLQYDDFWSYDNQILMQIQKINPAILPVTTYGAYDFSAGTGGLDVLLYSGSGASNLKVGPSGAFSFQDPAAAPSGGESVYDGFWGSGTNDPKAKNSGPVTVGQVLDYLHALNPQNSIPVFYMDLNQTGKVASLLFGGQVMLVDPTTGQTMHVWSMDTQPQAGDGAYDRTYQALAAGEIDLGIYGTINNNIGSGKADFIAYAPTMDLSLFDRDWLFVTEFNMSGLNDGYEEIFLTGAIAPSAIPEPGTVVLVGAGLMGLGLCGLRRTRN